MKNLIIATGNAHKMEEFGQLLAGSGFEVHSAATCGGMPEVDETGKTFAANAQIKAAALRRIAPQASWVLADDSGLEVDSLGGEPGIYSARYAGAKATDAENVQKLLNALKDVPIAERSARFRCALCWIGPDGAVQHVDGTCEGTISHEPTGESGFGYDPVFIPEGHEQSFAELGDATKGALSHRAKAVQALLGVLLSG